MDGWLVEPWVRFAHGGGQVGESIQGLNDQRTDRPDFVVRFGQLHELCIFICLYILVYKGR